MDFLEIDIICSAEYAEIFMAELAELGFSSFEEKEDTTGVKAYAAAEDLGDQQAIAELFERYSWVKNLSYSENWVSKENWNADWEKHYEPIIVEDKCLVRATFHEAQPSYPYEIIVTPKMSFGTGHHETTYQILAMQLSLDHQGKTVLDAGCGTGILAIMAAKRGASTIQAFDIDEWSVENSKENITLNGVNQIDIQQGTVESVNLLNDFDIILANINRNVLLHDMPHYAAHLKTDGILMLSGFYEDDIPTILEEAQKNSLQEIGRSERNNWAALQLIKK